MNAVWYVLWTGRQWKALRRDCFGVSTSTAHARFQTWQQSGIFEQIMRRLVKYYGKKRRVKWKWKSLDRKICPSPLGGDEASRNPTDRGKQGSKLHLPVDRWGAPLAVVITGANRHDKAAALEVIAGIASERYTEVQHLYADAAYDSADTREFVMREGYTPHIKTNRRCGGEAKYRGFGEATNPARRWVIERTLSWLTKRRGVRTRWAKKASNWLALIQLACAHILFNLSTFT